MDRIIKLSDVKKVVDETYEKYKDLDKGTVDKNYGDNDSADFAIVVTLTDGTEITRGDADKRFVMGALVKIPVMAELFSQFDGARHYMKMLKKANGGTCGCGCSDTNRPAEQPVCPRGVRSVSAVEPRDDRDGKMTVISDRIVAMTGSDLVFDDKIFEARMKAVETDDTVNKFAQAGYFLLDNAEDSIYDYTKLESLTATTRQLAMMGATLAADGVNPVTNRPAFDGKYAQDLLATMAVHGPHAMKRWLVKAQLPAKSGRGGAMLAVLPGVMAIAAYSPSLNDCGVSVRAHKAIARIARKLQLSIFASARVKIEK